MNVEKRELTQKEKNIFTIILTLIVLVFFLGWNLFDNYIKAKKEREESMKIALVQDPSRYFTVLGCAKKFLNYNQTGSSSEIVSLLNEEYRTAFKITEENVKNFVPKLDRDSIYDYAGGEMYQQRISKNVVKYYLKGQIKKSNLDEEVEYVDYDMTIILYEDRLVFSIKPGIGDLIL